MYLLFTRNLGIFFVPIFTLFREYLGIIFDLGSFSFNWSPMTDKFKFKLIIPFSF